jgi:hypothetical protein
LDGGVEAEKRIMPENQINGLAYFVRTKRPSRFLEWSNDPRPRLRDPIDKTIDAPD